MGNLKGAHQNTLGGREHFMLHRFSLIGSFCHAHKNKAYIFTKYNKKHIVGVDVVKWCFVNET